MKLKKILLLGISALLLTGCTLQKDSLDDATIYTTIYPITYLTNYLYSEHGTIESIYPAGADVNNYSLTDKQIKKYSKGDLFIYNGLSNEKNTAKDLIKKNKNLLIIDVTNGLNYTYDIKELWMSPNNYLMLAKNIKDYLNEYLESSIIKESIDTLYNELSENLSIKDAELRAIGEEAKENGTNTLIVSDDALKFLENYDFNIISLDEESLTTESFEAIENAFKKKTYKNILVLDNNYTDNINNLIDNYKANSIDVYSLTNIDDTENIEDYLTNMQNLIDNIKNLCNAD